jgi:hypothetical protein
LTIADCRLIQPAFRNQQFILAASRPRVTGEAAKPKLAADERRLVGGTGLEPVAAGV